MGDRDAAAFLAAIIARPDDDLPRLIYADWLDERGEPERAEFIRVQCELARPEPPLPPECVVGGCPVACELCTARHRHAALRARERELLRNASRQWVEDGYRWLPDGWPFDSAKDGTRMRWDWHRGFIESLHLAAADWLAHADQLIAATPVRSVTLATWPDLTRPPGYSGYWGLPGRPRIYFLPDAPSPDGGMRDLTLAVLAAEWPGVTFVLPVSPVIRIAGYTPTSRVTVSYRQS